MSLSEMVNDTTCDGSNPIKQVLNNVMDTFQKSKELSEIDPKSGQGLSLPEMTQMQKEKIRERMGRMARHYFHDKDDQFITQQLGPMLKKLEIDPQMDGSFQGGALQNMKQMGTGPDGQFDMDIDLTKGKEDEEFVYMNYLKLSYSLDSIIRNTNDYEFSTDVNPYLGNSNAFQVGEKLQQQGELNKAILAFESAVQQNPNNVKYWMSLGRANAEFDNDESAIRAFSTAFKLNPDNLEVLLELGVSYTNELSSVRATVFLKAWLEKHEKYSHIVKNHPSTQKIFQDEEEETLWKYSNFEANVQDMFLQASKQNPEDASLHSVLGVLHSIADNSKEAIHSFREAVKYNPDDPINWNRLGATLANSKQQQEAIECYRKALAKKPNYIRAWVNLAIAHANSNQHMEALKYFIQSLKMAPESNHIWSYIAMALQNLDRYDLIDLISQKDLAKLEQALQL